MNDKIVAAIIAGVVSIVGVIVNMYLNSKANKEAIKRLKIEFQLESQNKANKKFIELVSKIAEFKHVLNSILFKLSHSEKNFNWKEAGEEIKDSYQELISLWHKTQYEIRDFKMKKSQEIGRHMHDAVSPLPQMIIMQVGHLTFEEPNQEVIERIKKSIESLHDGLDKLLDMIIEEKKSFGI